MGQEVFGCVGDFTAGCRSRGGGECWVEAAVKSWFVEVGHPISPGISLRWLAAPSCSNVIISCHLMHYTPLPWTSCRFNTRTRSSPVSHPPLMLYHGCCTVLTYIFTLITLYFFIVLSLYCYPNFSFIDTFHWANPDISILLVWIKHVASSRFL
jgi:hypothetical protein